MEMNAGAGEWLKPNRCPTCRCVPRDKLIGRSRTATVIDRGVGPSHEEKMFPAYRYRSGEQALVIDNLVCL